MKKIFAMLLAMVMVFSMVGCSRPGAEVSEGPTEESRDPGTGEVHKIVILSFDVTGALYEASCAYLDYLSEELGFEYEYVSGGYSSQEQIATVETYLAQGYRGIIFNNDLGGAEAILDMCNDYDAYVGGYWCDFASSIYSTGAPNMAVLQNERFVGSSNDGKASLDDTAEAMFNAIVLQDGHTKIGIAVMPAAWYPQQISSGVTRFVELVEEYNAGDKAATGGEPITLVQTGNDDSGAPIYYEQVDGATMSFSSSFFTNNEMTACASFASTNFTYGPLVESKANIALYATGWESPFAEDFGSNGLIKQITVSPVETLIFPLVQILDRLNGHVYEDVPTGEASFGKIADTDQVFITGDEGLAAFQKSLHYTGDGADAYFSVDDVKSFMLTYNGENATYAQLCQALASNAMTIEALKNR